MEITGTYISIGTGSSPYWYFWGRPKTYFLVMLLPPSTKEYNYEIRVSQTSSSLTKFILNNINTFTFK